MGLVVFLLIGLVAASIAVPADDFCGDKSCGLKCSSNENCVEDNSIECFRSQCCHRCSYSAPDLCAGKRCGEQCDASLGLLQVVRYCQPDGSCGTNARPSCTENPCSSGRPLTDPSGVELFCGRGPNRVECPTGSSCLVHPTDRYALCCPEEAPKQEGESCGSCFCPPTYSAGDCAEGLTCERDERIPDAAGICTRPENPCSSGRPLTNPSGVELFCGRGPNRVECPTGSSCLVHPTDRYALCCPEEAPKQEGESCGSCFCPPTYSAGDCEEGLTCERDERIPDAAGICTRPAPPKKEGEECGSCLCPPTFSAGDCEEGLTCVRDERIPDLAGICTRPAPDLCAGKGCGEQCDSSLGLLQVVRYCQPDGSCGTNARPSCPESRKKVGEKCGSCFCPPTFSAGTCEDGLICKRDPRIPDRAGVCEPNPVKGIVFPQK